MIAFVAAMVVIDNLWVLPGETIYIMVSTPADATLDGSENITVYAEKEMYMQTSVKLTEID